MGLYNTKVQNSKNIIQKYKNTKYKNTKYKYKNIHRNTKYFIGFFI